jgi:hypothetical protein
MCCTPSFSRWWSQKTKPKIAMVEEVHKLRWIHCVMARQGFFSLGYGGLMPRDNWYGEQCLAIIHLHTMATHLVVPGKRYDEYIAPTWPWCSVKDAAIEPQEVRSGNIRFTKVIDINIIPDRKLNPATPLSNLRYCCSPGSFLRLRCSYLPIVELGPLSGMKLMNFRAATQERGRGEEAIDLESKNYWDVESSQEAIDCKSPIAVPIFARTDFANSVYCLALDGRRGKNGSIWYIRLGAFVITDPEDVLRFWEEIEEFDKHMPEECPRHDGLYRYKELKWGKCMYVKMDEVLQRIVEIRWLDLCSYHDPKATSKGSEILNVQYKAKYGQNVTEQEIMLQGEVLK